jgi:hypothetical protein
MCGRCGGCSGCGGNRQEPAGNAPSLNVVRHATGRDYSVAGVHGLSTLGVPFTAFNQEAHVAEPTRFSAWGQAMKAHALALVRPHNPIPGHRGYRGFITNNIRVPGAIHPPVTFPQGYDGMTPLTLQPLIKKPYPYNVPRYSPGVTTARTVVQDAELQGGVMRP